MISKFIQRWGAPTLEPEELTGDVNNYNPGNLNEYVIVSLTSTKRVKVTGIDTSSFNKKQLFVFLNENDLYSGNNIIFKKNSGDSLEQNRFHIIKDIELKPGGFVILIYSDKLNKILIYNQ